MSLPSITPELRLWVLDQVRANFPPEVVLEAMRESGWDADTAVAAYAEVVAGQAGTPSAAGPSTLLKVPDPLPSGARVTLWAGDRDVDVIVSLTDPRIVVFGNLLSHAECDEIVALARTRLARSETVEIATGATEVNDARTSDGMFFERGETAICERLELRIAALLNWPVENGEGLQVLHYAPGAEYKPHYDYFDPDQPGTPAILLRGGQRVASLVCYLNTPTLGGETVFPDVSLLVAPLKGNAVFFSYDRPHPATKSLHGGMPVVEGEKWVATKWLRERRFD